ncbi:expressed unknown protein [Seminavis robusta]|uniref:Uncharacterized protein n=1 Tax=Seminavis robusta TaxID=568900 RepID=A0A9N8HG46_9STRA|nr:expressed unknown protein [Seminavis robusta]|eukprot:Sro464_g148420.1 n/a (526) ;mRNA; f:44255-45832
MPSLIETLHQGYLNDDLYSQAQEILVQQAGPKPEPETLQEALQIASSKGRFDVVELIASCYTDIDDPLESVLGWTKLFQLVIYGTTEELEVALQAAKENQDILEQTDTCHRTPFLCSILVGDRDKAQRLLQAGSNPLACGQEGEPPVFYAICHDNVDMLNFLISKWNGDNQDGGGTSIVEQTDRLDNTPLMHAVRKRAVQCVNALLREHKVNVSGDNNPLPSLVDDNLNSNCSTTPVISNTTTREILFALVQAGARMEEMDSEDRAKLRGYANTWGKWDELLPTVSADDFADGCCVQFGDANPERVEDPFWKVMVQCGASAYSAFVQFESSAAESCRPIWSFDRFGKSCTLLPDGRFVEIAGEHEDYYDPDFAIYNDVVVHDGKGNCEFYSYPEEVFPCTDFHTATLVPSLEEQLSQEEEVAAVAGGSMIYIIGCVGYPQDRRPGFTPVFGLHVDTWKMERIETSGDMPGWIARHKAVYDPLSSSISITGGWIIVNPEEGRGVENKDEFTLNLQTRAWTRKSATP